MAIVQAVTDHLKKDPTNRTLLTTLAELWVTLTRALLNQSNKYWGKYSGFTSCASSYTLILYFLKRQDLDWSLKSSSVYLSWSLVLLQVHVRPAVRQSLRNLPETEAQRCLPADPQTQPFRLHRGQDRSPHGLWQRGKSLKRRSVCIFYGQVYLFLFFTFTWLIKKCRSFSIWVIYSLNVRHQKAVDMLLDNEDKISVSVPDFSQSFIKDLMKVRCPLILPLFSNRQTGWWKNWQTGPSFCMWWVEIHYI